MTACDSLEAVAEAFVQGVRLESRAVADRESENRLVRARKVDYLYRYCVRANSFAVTGCSRMPGHGQPGELKMSS